MKNNNINPESNNDQALVKLMTLAKCFLPMMSKRMLLTVLI